MGAFRDFVAKTILRYRVSRMKRRKMLLPFSQIRNAGLLFEITTQKDFSVAQRIVRDLKSGGKKVMSIGYYPGKELPDFCIGETTGYCFNHKELSFFGLPRSDYLRKFCHIEFDLLIDLSVNHHFILEYLSALSVARVKMAVSQGNQRKSSDILIQTKNPVGLEEAYDLMMHYLLALNSGKSPAANI